MNNLSFRCYGKCHNIRLKGANPVPEAPTWVGSGEGKNWGKPPPAKSAERLLRTRGVVNQWDSSRYYNQDIIINSEQYKLEYIRVLCERSSWWNDTCRETSRYIRQSKSDCEISRNISQQKYNVVLYGSIAHEKNRGSYIHTPILYRYCDFTPVFLTLWICPYSVILP